MVAESLFQTPNHGTLSRKLGVRTVSIADNVNPETNMAGDLPVDSLMDNPCPVLSCSLWVLSARVLVSVPGNLGISIKCHGNHGNRDRTPS